VTEPLATAVVLSAVGLLLLLAGLASPLPGRLGVPALLVFLGVGMLAGSEGLGGIPFDDYALAFRLGSVALVLILFDGGLNTPAAVVRRVAAPAGALATAGVVLTAALTAGAGLLFGLPSDVALLVGAVVSSTDAAAVFSVLRSHGLRLDRSTAATLEVESGLNDPLAMPLTVAATEWVLGETTGVAGALGTFALQLGVGAAAGFGCGRVGRTLLHAIPLPAAGLYPVVTVALAFLSFGVATLAGGSGLLSVYLTGIVLTAGHLPYRAGVRRVHDSLAWLAQILMFLPRPARVSVAARARARDGPRRRRGDRVRGAAAGGARRARAVPRRRVARAPLRVLGRPARRGADRARRRPGPARRRVRRRDLPPGVLRRRAEQPGPRRDGGPGRAPARPRAGGPADARREHRAGVAARVPRRVRLVLRAPGLGGRGRLRAGPAAAGGQRRALVLHGAEVVVPRGSTPLRPGDQVCFFVTPGSRALLDLPFGTASG
jgi:hypothetical protein